MKYFIVSYRWAGDKCTGIGELVIAAHIFFSKKYLLEQAQSLTPKIEKVFITSVTRLTKQEYDLYIS